MNKRFKKILAVLLTICMSASVMALIAACDNGGSSNTGTTTPPAPIKPDESQGGGGGGGGMGQQPTGDPVEESEVPEYDESEVVVIGEIGEVYSVTFTDAFAVTWTTDGATGSYMLAVYDQNSADAATLREGIELYVKQDGAWKKFTVNAMGPIGTGLNPTGDDTELVVVVKVADTAEETTWDYITLTENSQGGH